MAGADRTRWSTALGADHHWQRQNCIYRRETSTGLEARIAQLVEELEEEQINTELTDEQHKKLAMTVEQSILDPAAEKTNEQKAEISQKIVTRGCPFSRAGRQQQSRTTESEVPQEERRVRQGQVASNARRSRR